MATLSRNLAREQAAARAAIERTNAKIEASRASAIASATTVVSNILSSGASIVAAIQGLSIPPPRVNINVTSTDIQRATTRRRRVVKPNGSRGAWLMDNG